MTSAPIPLVVAAVLAVGVGPDFGAVTGSRLYPIIGAVLTVALVVAVAILVICAFLWPIASASGNWQATSKARAGVLISVAGAVLTGGALAWTNWLIDLGNTL
jgi:threonine/homoserine efflux transporter RhtA